MITVAAFLLVVALGLLVGGLLEGSAALQWGSFAASVLAALVLLLSWFGQRRAGGRSAPRTDEQPFSGAARAGTPPISPVVDHEPPARWAPAPSPVADQDPPARWAPAPSPVVDQDAAVRRVSPPPVPPSSPSIPRVVAPTSRSDVGGPAASGRDVGPADMAGGPDGRPPVEVVEFSDVLMSMDLADDVLVLRGQPRYHLARCPYLAGEAPVPLPLDQARADGFTPCGVCAPDRTLAARERARRG